MNNLKKINIGIIGAGMMAENHAECFLKTGKVNISWVADLDLSKRNDFKNKFTVEHATADYHEMLADRELHAVVIVTPPWTHFPIFSDCVNAGKHILIEKPASCQTDDLNKMFVEVEKHPELVICEASCRHARLQPKFIAVKNIIDSGKLGEIYYIHHNAVSRQNRPGIEYHPEAKWFLDKKLAGAGPLYDWGVYDLSFHLGILSDKPELISCETLFKKSGLDNIDPQTSIYDVEEHFAVVMKFTENLTYYWERAVHANNEVPDETRIYGTEGGLKLSYYSWASPEIEFFDVEGQGKGKARIQTILVDMKNHPGDNYELCEHFINCIINKEAPMMPVSLAKKHLDILFTLGKQ